MREDIRLVKISVVVVVVSTILHFIGLMLIDYGATFYCLRNIVLQTLLFSEIEPRVMYHSGIVLITLSFLFLSISCLEMSSCRVKEK